MTWLPLGTEEAGWGTKEAGGDRGEGKNSFSALHTSVLSQRFLTKVPLGNLFEN